MRVANATIIPHFKEKPVNSLTRADIVALHKKLKHTPSAANHGLATIKLVINWMETEGLRGELKKPSLSSRL